MAHSPLGVAVIGAGMVGRAHANAYRNAATVFDASPAPRLVAIADLHEPFAADAARRYGYSRAETDWRAVIDAPDIDAVSVAVANDLHREIVEAALAAGKHVLCEKPLAPSVGDAQAMVDAAAATDRIAAVGFTFRRSPPSTPCASRCSAAGSAGCGTSSATTGPTTDSIRGAR
nr:hypothetical protein GCM10020092_048840 [Actinoplanes digitatis]